MVVRLDRDVRHPGEVGHGAVAVVLLGRNCPSRHTPVAILPPLSHDFRASPILSPEARPGPILSNSAVTPTMSDAELRDCFLSYNSREQPRAHELAAALGRRGLSLWWDEKEMQAGTCQTQLEDGLRNSRCVVVVIGTARSSAPTGP